MDTFTPSDMKTILHSKRANIYYLEHCRILVNAGRVEYITEMGKRSLYWNIPIANTTTLLLGTGTSVTQASIRELAKAGVLVGFCGGGGTPLFSANEVDFDVAWFVPQSEYRPTQYLQKWVGFWFEEKRRLAAAIILQRHRLERILLRWLENRGFQDQGFMVDKRLLESHVNDTLEEISVARDISALLTIEARLSKRLFRIAAQTVGYGEFSRHGKGRGTDPANRNMDHGNYLAYGLGATAAWVMGLPQGLAILHGKTRRGGLVFDIADLVKDAVILPQAFISAMRGDDQQEFRDACISNLADDESLDFMIDTIKLITERMENPEL